MTSVGGVDRRSNSHSPEFDPHCLEERRGLVLSSHLIAMWTFGEVVNVTGLTTGAKASLSSLPSNVREPGGVTLSLPVKAIVAPVLFVKAEGPLAI